jgi:3-oxoacyl-[acyl-carrier-protein] synthase-3
MVSAMKGVKVSGIEFHLGGLRETNRDLLVENPSWDIEAIERATGIACRSLAKVGECASDLAVEAAEKLFAKGMVRREEIDALILCTQSPDYLLPTTACGVQERLKLSTTTAAFDINLGCSGYVYGLAIASAMLKSGLSKKLLLLNADTYSKFVSKTDRTCRPIFGDGAAATLVETTDCDDAIGPFDLGTDGRGGDKLIMRRSGMRNALRADDGGGVTVGDPERFALKMDGAGVMMFTMRAVPKSVEALLNKARLTKEDVDLYFFHQASRSVLDNIVRHLDLPDEKVFRGFGQIGNMVSASIPIALKQAVDQGRLLVGQRIVLAGFGVGYSWGACVLRWSA